MSHRIIFMLKKSHFLQVVFFLAYPMSCTADEFMAPDVNISLSSTSSARVVITFDSVGLRENASVPENVTLVKQYGRRLVVLLDHDYDAESDREWLMGLFNASDVEHDSLVLSNSLSDSSLDTELMLQTLGQLEMWNSSQDTEQSLQTFGQSNMWNSSQDTEQSLQTFGQLNMWNSSQDTEQWLQNFGQLNTWNGSQDNQNLLETLRQWNLDEEEPFSIHPNLLWNSTRGKVTQVIGVLDGGLPDISLPLFQHIVPGYDFISDETYSLDGDGRDDNSEDPGDAAPECPVSSWHGLQVTSVLAATPTDALPFKGVCSECSVLPVRVLGKCKTGYTSDVADALVWATGGTITGVEPPQKSAGIIAMSFTGLGRCSSYLQSAVTQAVNSGAILVAAAGNAVGNSEDYFPGNCKGVVTVAASIRGGTLATYSNIGSNIVLAAPGGDSSNPIPVLTVNANSSAVQLSSGVGTSFSVPHVAGVVALGLSSGLPITAHNVALLASNYEDEQQDSCVKSRNCGSGILDARRLSASFEWDSSAAFVWDTLSGNWTDNSALVYGQAACAAGTFGASGNSPCTICPPGTYSSASASACSLCAAGLNSPGGSSACASSYPWFATGTGWNSGKTSTINAAGIVTVQTATATTQWAVCAVSPDGSFLLVNGGYNVYMLPLGSSSSTYTLIAGSSVSGYVDSPVGTSAKFAGTGTGSISRDGSFAVLADSGNYRVRILSLLNTNAVSTLAGTGSSGTLDGPGSSATFNGVTAAIIVSTQDAVLTMSSIANSGIRRISLAWPYTVTTLVATTSTAYPTAMSLSYDGTRILLVDRRDSSPFGSIYTYSYPSGALLSTVSPGSNVFYAVYLGNSSVVYNAWMGNVYKSYLLSNPTSFSTFGGAWSGDSPMGPVAAWSCGLLGYGIDNTATGNCVQCAANTYSIGSGSCLTCPTNTSSAAGASACCAAGLSAVKPTIISNGAPAQASQVVNDPTRQYFQFSSTSGTNTFSFPMDTTAQVLVVGGGGAGSGRAGGGGGAGGLVYHAAYTFTANVLYTVTVGAGGAGGSTLQTVQNSGTYSSITFSGGTTFYAAGGGAGGFDTVAAKAGGSSGGGCTYYYSVIAVPAVSTANVNANMTPFTAGNLGGAGMYSTANSCSGAACYSAAGGGGAGGSGYASIQSPGSSACTKGGAGGDGLAYSITGISATYAAGGGGGSNFACSAGAGGSGGVGGAGANQQNTAGSGLPNTGSGGGGAGFNAAGNGVNGAGGSGVVIIQWSTCAPCTPGYYLGANSACTPCPTGSYSVATGATSSATCTPCPAGKYSAAAGASACVSCPVNSNSSAGASVCGANAGFYDLGMSLKAYYTFEAGTDITVDSASSGIGSLTQSTTPVTSVSSPTGTTGKSTNTGNVAYFSQAGSTGASTDTAKGQSLSLPTFSWGSSFSVCLWYMPGSPVSGRSYDRMLDFANGAMSGNIIACHTGTGSNVEVLLRSGTTTVSDSGWSGYMVANQWGHLCVAVSGTTGYVYLNGVQKTISMSASITTGTYTMNYIARSNQGDYLFAGYIDEVRLYPRALTSAEVSAIYAYTSPVTTNMLFLSCSASCTGGRTGHCNSAGVSVCCVAGTYFPDGLISQTTCMTCPIGTTVSASGGACECSIGTVVNLTSSTQPSITDNGVAGKQGTNAPGTPNYYYSFTSTAGTNSIRFPVDTNVSVLVVGGGGSGGIRVGGGGGAGGLVYKAAYTFAANILYTVVVGAGGAARSDTTMNWGYAGSPSYISASGTNVFYATGGGNGMWNCNGYPAQILSGGSTGGMDAVCTAAQPSTININAGSTPYTAGTLGGSGANTEANSCKSATNCYAGGGGGGAGSVGGNGVNSPGSQVCATGGTGGAGLAYNIIGVNTVYAAGGGGGVNVGCTAGPGGSSGVGGAGSSGAVTAGSGLPNTGSGGGGGGFSGGSNGLNGAGGSGVVIVHWSTCVKKTCTPGYYLASSGDCTACAAGSYSASSSVSSCTQCAAGYYSGTSGASSCTACDAGYGASPGASSCTLCSAGTYSVVGSQCTQCAAGYYSQLSGASVCDQCPGSLISSPGTSSVESCICPSNSLRVADYECVCNDGFLPVNSTTVTGLYSCVICDFSKIVSSSHSV